MITDIINECQPNIDSIKNLNDVTIVKNLINTLEKLLYELITKIDKVEKEKTKQNLVAE